MKKQRKLMLQNIFIKMKSNAHKTTTYLFTILVAVFNVTTQNLSAQLSQKPILQGLDTPFDFRNKTTFCNRDWMGSESTMDSLKWVIVKLDRKLNSLPQDTTLIFTDSLVLLYSYESVVRSDPWGEIGHQLCIDMSKYGTKTLVEKSDKGIKNEVISFDNKYVIVTDTYYYLGNSEIWTTYKKYYMRADKFKSK